MRLAKKLNYKKIGLFKILARIGTSACKLGLLPSMAIPNTFHISLLEAYQDNSFPSQINEPTSSIQIEGEDKYELDEIINSQLHYNTLQYRAKWKNYSPKHDKVWYSAEIFDNAEQAVQQFDQQYPGKPGVDSLHDQQVILRTSTRRRTRTTLTQPGGQCPTCRLPRCPHYPDSSRSLSQEMAHVFMSWNEYFDDGCQIHLSEKQESGLYSQFTRGSRQPSIAHNHDWRQDIEANPGQDCSPQPHPQ